MNNTGLEDIFSLEVGPGWVALAILNSHAGLLLKTSSSTVIFDPISIDPAAFSRLDTIIITHEHWDHLDIPLITDIQRRTGALVLTTPFVAQLLREIPSPNIEVMEPGDSVLHEQTCFYALESLHPGYQPLSFLISTGERVRLYYPVDSDPFPEMGLLAGDPGIDGLIYLGGSSKKAIEIANLVQPRNVLCCYIAPEALARATKATVVHLNHHQAYLLHSVEKIPEPSLTQRVNRSALC